MLDTKLITHKHGKLVGELIIVILFYVGINRVFKCMYQNNKTILCF